MAVYKRRILYLVLFLGFILTSGCETARGVAAGIGSAAGGVGRDARNAYNFMQVMDRWIKENLW